MTSVDAGRPFASPVAAAGRSWPWRHVPGLDGLRAFAVIAVLLFHGGYLTGGFLGVDLFFALSGYLITSLLIRDASGPGVSLGAFWGRRFRRLLPAVFTMIVVVAVWVAAFGSPAELDRVRRDGPWALAYSANWHSIASSGGYWESFSQPSMFNHLWSLAIEEQFYLVWPVVIAVVWRWAPRPSRAITTVCTIGIAASLATMVLVADSGAPTRAYMGTDTRAASLLFGALAATPPCRRMIARLVTSLGAATTALTALVGGLVLWSWVAVDGASSASLYRGGLALHSAAGALLVTIVATAPSAPIARALGWRPLAWIGVISYGLYLWHWPVFIVLSPQRTHLDGLGLFALRIATSIAFAVASFHLVEDPIRRRAAWTRGPAAIPALAGAVLVVALVLGALPAPDTEIAAFDPRSVVPTVASAPTAPPAPSAAPDLVAPTIPAPATTSPATAVAAPATAPPASTAPATTTPPPPPTDPPRLAPIQHAVWAGDSIAWDMAPGVKAALTAAGVPIDANAASVGMRLLEADRFTDMAKAVRIRLENDGTDTVILQLSVWDASKSAPEQLVALTMLRDLVLAHGARLVLVRPPVTADEAINAGVAAMAATAQALSAEDPSHLVFLDPSAVWGPTAALDLDGDGTPERKPDLIHVCPSGAARFGAWLADQLAARFDGVTAASPEVWATGSWVTDDRYDMPTGACAPVG